MLKRLLATGGVSAALFVGIAVMSVPTASAAAGSCPSGATCAWTGTNYTGTIGPVYGNNTNDKQYATWAGAESVANNGTSCEDWVFQNENYGGSVLALPIGYGDGNLSGTWAWHHLWSNHWCNQ